jgi:hypothetical protein
MGFRIVSHNDFNASYHWDIANTNLSGSGVVDAGQTLTINLTQYYPGLVSLYAGQQLMDSGYLPKTCSGFTNTPTPTLNPTQVVKTLIPQTSSTPEILIPVTGVDLVGGNSLPHMLFNLGLGFLGLGFVMNGLARRRRELDL